MFLTSLFIKLQSIGFLFGQVLSPADTPDAIFSKGTVASCEAIGYVFIVGSMAILWYTLFLTYYFLKRVKYQKTPKEFARQEEYYITLFIWMYSIVFASVALQAEEINAKSYGSTCVSNKVDLVSSFFSHKCSPNAREINSI